MVDPTSELEEGISEEDAPKCEVCGEPIVENPGHRVHTEIVDGEAVHYHFCSDDHRDEWRAGHA